METVFKVLGDHNRLRILHLLMQQELCVCEIEEILQTTQSNASRHLTKLKQAGVISCTKKAQWVYYQVHTDFIISHSLLHEYLKEQQESKKIYQDDLKTLQRFNEKQESCKTLA